MRFLIPQIVRAIHHQLSASGQTFLSGVIQVQLDIVEGNEGVYIPLSGGDSIAISARALSWYQSNDPARSDEQPSLPVNSLGHYRVEMEYKGPDQRDLVIHSLAKSLARQFEKHAELALLTYLKEKKQICHKIPIRGTVS